MAPAKLGRASHPIEHFICPFEGRPVPSGLYTAGCNAYRVWSTATCWATLEDIGHPSSANPRSGRFVSECPV
ncbi:hypothetical protein Sajous1_123 [Salmonella phage Sajous1]|nr:hypothetical protein [Salmonella phage AR2819]QPX74535.1 hypothetical protein Sajous1_123 [Salmonella phage Sajous1]UYL83799.1 hypothetical protein GUERRERO_183 [Salmonella phage Guerrero]